MPAVLTQASGRGSEEEPLAFLRSAQHLIVLSCISVRSRNRLQEAQSSGEDYLKSDTAGMVGRVLLVYWERAAGTVQKE